MQTSLRRSLLALFLAATLGPLSLLGTGCQSAPGMEQNHWNIESLTPRLGYYFFGYREDLDGTFRDHQWRQKKDINLTIRRHLLNNNPTNPFEADDPSFLDPRPPHSILPDPLLYFHLESIVFGAAFLAAADTFIPIPIGSVIASFTPGGGEEFMEGINTTLSGSFTHAMATPPPPDSFRVRNPDLLR